MRRDDVLPRCDTCHRRHPDVDDCVEPGEEGYISRDELLDAFRLRNRVCLACQSVWDADVGTDECPDCGQPWERFADDDLSPDGPEDHLSQRRKERKEEEERT
jgi:hypothetical protein